LSKLDQMILCVPTSRVDEIGRIVGFSPHAAAHVTGLFGPSPDGPQFRRRGDVEDDPTWQQIIPYVIFRHADQVFGYRRGSLSDARVTDKLSIGVGGHMEESDFPHNAFTSEHAAPADYTRAMLRELAEEVGFDPAVHVDPKRGSRLAGLLKIATTPIDAVHLGIVHEIWLRDTTLTSTEDLHLADPHWYTIPELQAATDRFETWSQLVIDGLLASE